MATVEMVMAEEVAMVMGGGGQGRGGGEGAGWRC